MNIFDFENYKKYVNKRISLMPKGGRGQYQRIAEFLNINSVTVSQIFNGDRDLTPEQACDLCEHFGFTELESNYFINLVLYERAGTPKLRQKFKAQISEFHKKSQDLKQRLKQDFQLSDSAKAVFYSGWFYSGVRLATSLPDLNTADEIAEYFDLPVKRVSEILEFLMQQGLCKIENGKFRMGPSQTHLEAANPLIIKHHTNWRLKGITKMEKFDPDELFVSIPASLSKNAIKEIRRELVEAVERICQKIDAGPEETLACLGIDFFKF